MQGLVNRYKGDGIVSVLEDMIEPLLLFLAVAQNIECIPLIGKLMERLAQQIEILMVERLQRCLKTQGSVGCLLHALIKAYLVERSNVRQKLLPGQHVSLYKGHILRVDLQFILVERLYGWQSSAYPLSLLQSYPIVNRKGGMRPPFR